MLRGAAGAVKIASRRWAEEEIGQDGAEETVHHQLTPRVEGANDDVYCDPSKRQPTRLVVAAKHVGSREDCGQAEELDQQEVGLHRVRVLEVGEWKREGGRADRDVDPGDDGD